MPDGHSDPTLAPDQGIAYTPDPQEKWHKNTYR